jgi:hypothetical protein
MAALTITAKSKSATLGDNTLGRKFLDPNEADTQLSLKRFYYKNLSGATLADGSIIDLGAILGPCVITQLSGISVSAMGATRVLNLGIQEYNSQADNSVVASAIAGLVSALDVSSARTDTLFDVGVAAVQDQGLQIYGQARLLAQITGGTIPANGIIAGVLLLSKPL